MLTAALVQAQTATKPLLPAFPGAEGGGAYTVGGRRGAVIEVTNLKGSGPGSLRAACEASGKRTVVFRVGGTIDLGDKDIAIKNDFITIAGQTAPGDGIQIKGGRFYVSANQVILRYLRLRPGPAHGAVDGLTFGSPDRRHPRGHAIIDHVSAFWGVDETMDVGSFYKNLTVQWCIIAEGLHESVYSGKESWKPYDGVHWAHSRGLMVTAEGKNTTLHHNLIFNSYKRNPLVQSSDVDVVNNVCVSGSYLGYTKPAYAPVHVNWVGNYFRSQVNIRPPIRVYKMDFGSLSGGYYEDNYHPVFRPKDSLPETDIRKLESGGTPDVPARYDLPLVTTQPVHDAYASVLELAGANFPARDAADARVVDAVKKKTRFVLVNHPRDVGGWPTLKEGTAPADKDHDGMPDAWEMKHELNPNDPADRNGTKLSKVGYTNLEVYINGLIEKFNGQGIKQKYAKPPKSIPIPSKNIASVADNETGKPRLIDYPLEKDSDGDNYPDGYEHKNGSRRTLSIVDVDGAKSLKFDSQDVTYVRTRSAFQTFKPNTKYLLKVEMNVENLITTSGKWPDGIHIYVYHGGNDNEWIGITGSGSSKGWMTAVLPFDTGAKPSLDQSRIMLIMGNMSGTVWFRNATIETYDDAEIQKGRYFLVGKKKVGGSILKLR